MQDQARLLSKEIEIEEKECVHEWGETINDPFLHKEPDLTGTGGLDVSTGRWRRDCQKCGKPQYTTRIKPVGYVPSFE